jgi:hypothetical protein
MLRVYVDTNRTFLSIFKYLIAILITAERYRNGQLRPNEISKLRMGFKHPYNLAGENNDRNNHEGYLGIVRWNVRDGLQWMRWRGVGTGESGPGCGG